VVGWLGELAQQSLRFRLRQPPSDHRLRYLPLAIKLVAPALPPAHRRFELIPPHFLGAISGSQNRGALMRQIISSVYGALLIAIWLCVMGTVIAVLDSGEPKWLLVVAGFVAATITVTLVEEFIGWRSRPTKSALEQRST
jgi:hypothetical protein